MVNVSEAENIGRSTRCDATAKRLGLAPVEPRG